MDTFSRSRLSLLHRTRPALVALFFSAWASSETRGGFAADNPDGGGTLPANGEGGIPGDLGPQADAGHIVECSADAKNKIFVASAENVLYSFDPVLLKMERIGVVNCTSVDSRVANGNIHSMAVDRAGTAWVNIDGWGEDFKVDTKTGLCSATGMTFHSQTFSLQNMVFSAESTDTELLYLTTPGSTVMRFASIDTAGLKLVDRGNLVGDLIAPPIHNNDPMELTGTADGKLYGLFSPGDVNQPHALAQINKANGEVTKIVDVTGTGGRSTQWAYAFSFWGGDIWIYFTPNPETNSKVIRYKMSGDKSQEVVMNPNDVGFRISGAGVSTCAPLVPPVVK